MTEGTLVARAVRTFMCPAESQMGDFCMHVQAATLYYADGGSFERVANTQRSSVDGAELGKGSMSARGTSVAGDVYGTVTRF